MHISVSLHKKTNKSQKTNCSNPNQDLEDMVQLNYSSGGLMFHCFYNAADKPAIVFPPNSSLRSAQNKHADIVSELQGHLVCSHIMAHSQSASWFVGCKAKPEVTSSSEPPL